MCVCVREREREREKRERERERERESKRECVRESERVTFENVYAPAVGISG